MTELSTRYKDEVHCGLYKNVDGDTTHILVIMQMSYDVWAQKSLTFHYSLTVVHLLFPERLGWQCNTYNTRC